MGALAEELHGACLADGILRQFQRAGAEPGAAVDEGASGQGSRVGQRGAHNGLGRNAVGGRACGAGCRNGETGLHAGQNRSGRRTGEDRTAAGHVEVEQLAGGSVGIGGDQIKYLCARVVRRGGCATDDAGVGIERQTRGQQTVGDDGEVVDRVRVGVGGGIAGTQSELPVGTVGGVDHSVHIQVDDLRAVVADGEDVGAIEFDLYRFRPGAEVDDASGEGSLEAV